jgi:hypothetical protein
MCAMPTTVALLLTSLLLSATPDDSLAPRSLKGIKVKLPAAWDQKTQEDGSLRFDTPAKDGWLELQVFPVDPKRDGKVCLDQLLQALGRDGWEPTTVGGAPAARKETHETGTGKREDNSDISVEVQSNMFVGCNGSTKWVLTVAMGITQQGRLSTLTQKIIGSVGYGDAAAPGASKKKR